MKDPRTMTTLQTLANSAERETSRTLAKRRRVLETEEQRLAQLQVYLQEYTAGGEQRGVFADSMRARRDFVAQICAAIRQQEQLVAGLQQQLSAALARWQSARSHSLALERYAERLQAAEDEKDARREQSRLDEVGRQQFLTRSA